MSISSKIITICLLISLTILYGIYEKSKFDDLLFGKSELILKTLPKLNAEEVYSAKPVDSESILANSPNGFLIHFWGTWCAPCEVELPEFLSLARSLEQQNVKFYLLAVNDTREKVKKFMSRFQGQLPTNVELLIDPSGINMPVFGTARVPETYLFTKSGLHLNKYVGPQNWKMPGFLSQINMLLQSTH